MEKYCKVVIIDDEYIMRQGMKHMLDWEKEGFQIVGECSNGQEGLEVIEKVKPDIVLADIVMPVLDGIEFSEIVHKRFPQIQLLILSSFDKFEYVRTTLLNGASDYILKPTLNPENLLEALQKAARRIPGMQLRKKEKGSVQSQLERYISGFQEKLDEMICVKYFPDTLYCIVGIDLKKFCLGQKDKMMEIREYIHSFFHEKTEYTHFELFLEEEILCCLFNFKIKDKELIQKDIAYCAEKVQQIFGSAFFVLGEVFSNLSDIKKIYEKEIRFVVDQQFYYKGICLLHPDDRKHIKKEERFPVIQYSNLLSQNRFSEAFSMFQKYVQHLTECEVEEYKLKNITKNLLYNYLLEWEKLEEDTEEMRRIYFRMIDAAKYVDEFAKCFEKISQELLKNGMIDQSQEEIRISEIKIYIQKHYNEALDLAEIAKQFNYNYNYLSSYFGKHTKEGFSGYINKIRIEKACELLKQGKYSISEISSMIGYSDHSYFCRVFKKLIHVTPSVYKRQIKQR